MSVIMLHNCVWKYESVFFSLRVSLCIGETVFHCACGFYSTVIHICTSYYRIQYWWCCKGLFQHQTLMNWLFLLMSLLSLFCSHSQSWATSFSAAWSCQTPPLDNTVMNNCLRCSSSYCSSSHCIIDISFPNIRDEDIPVCTFHMMDDTVTCIVSGKACYDLLQTSNCW